MNVLYFHQHFSTPDGAASTRSYEFARQLIKEGHTVTIVCGSYWLAETGLNEQFKSYFREGKVDGIHIKEIDLKYSNSDNFIKRAITFFRFSWYGIKMVINSDYDVCFASSTPLTAGIPGIFAKIIRKKPFIFEVRDLWPELPKAMGVIKNPVILKMMDFLETSLYFFSSACIGLSPGIVEGIRKKSPKKKIKMIPNGCDFTLAKNININKKFNKTVFKAAFTGAHGYANGLNAVLDMAKILIERNENNIIIEFIGDGALKPQLIERAKKESLGNCIFKNPIPKKDLFNYLNNEIDVGLMILDDIPAFYYGTSPNKFFDYISLGLPVINNYPGWLSDLINENNCGLTVSPKDSFQFSESLIRLKNDKDLIKNMSKNATRLAKEQFDRKNLSKDFVKFLKSSSI